MGIADIIALKWDDSKWQDGRGGCGPDAAFVREEQCSTLQPESPSLDTARRRSR